MENRVVMLKYKSKRNQVIFQKTRNGKSVVKQFQHPGEWEKECKRYQILEKKSIKVPKILAVWPEHLELSYIEGKTALELLEEQENQGQFEKKIWSALADWLTTCALQGGFLLRDMNLGNFIYQEKEGCFYGVDFEGDTVKDYSEAIGILLAFIRLYDPPDTQVKKQICTFLSERFCRTLQLNPHILEQGIEQAYEWLIARRIKN